MAILTYRSVGPEPQTQHLVCDLASELPVSGMAAGDTAYTKDTAKWHVHSGSGWTLIGGGGSGTPSDTVVSGTSFGQAAAAGTAAAYSRADHTHGTPPFITLSKWLDF